MNPIPVARKTLAVVRARNEGDHAKLRSVGFLLRRGSADTWFEEFHTKLEREKRLRRPTPVDPGQPRIITLTKVTEEWDGRRHLQITPAPAGVSIRTLREMSS